jgi:hypothetical protein
MSEAEASDAKRQRTGESSRECAICMEANITLQVAVLVVDRKIVAN